MAASQKKFPKILYFVDGHVPSNADLLAAAEIGPVQYRNAQYIHPDDGCEPCDGVAGNIPSNYEHLPDAEEAVAAYKKAISDEMAELGEEAAPKKERKSAAKADGKKAWNGGGSQ